MTISNKIISLKNGLLDLNLINTMAINNCFIPSNPRYFTLNPLPVSFNQECKAPLFKRAIEEIFPNKEIQILVQETIGYLLLPITYFEKFFIFHGSGANGKSALLRCVCAMLGDNNYCSIPPSRFDQQFALNDLTTKLLNTVTELSNLSGFPEDKLKAIVSGDPIEIELKGKNLFTAKPTARIIFATNDLPKFSDRSDGIWRRVIIIPFERQFAEKEQDKYLAEKIIDNELSGVLNWALEGYKRLIQNNCFSEAECTKKIMNDHRLICNNEQVFINEFCVMGDEGDFIPTTTIYEFYKIFCKLNDFRPIDQTSLLNTLKAKFKSNSCRQSHQSDYCKMNKSERVRGLTNFKFSPDEELLCEFKKIF